MNSKSTMTQLLRLSEASRLLGTTPRTLRRWDAAGKIRTVRSVGNHRLIPMSEIERLRGEDGSRRKTTLVYCRCSTQKQKENLSRQTGRLLEYCLEQKWVPELFKDIGSGLNDNRKQFKKMLKRVSEKDVKRVLVEYRDRLCRYGFSMFQQYCAGFGVEVVVLEEKEPKEFEQELTHDIIALIASFSARLYGRRGGQKKKLAVK